MIDVVRRVLDEVQSHALAEHPRECCGMLLGTPGHIVDCARAANLEEGTTRFRIDPRDHIRAIRDARSRELDVVGFYHSHPRSRAYPSDTDVAEAGYAGVVHLIVGVDEQGEPEARLFTIDGATISELTYTTV